MTPVIQTRRLWLRPLQLSDADQVQEIFPHWEILRYLNAIVPWPYPPDGAQTFYRDIALPGVERGERWEWTLRLKTAPEQIIGGIGLMLAEDNNRGFWIGLPWQGHGLMSEACEAVTNFWFNALKSPRLRVPKAVANTPSGRISARQGMRIIAREERNYVGGRLPTEIWEITAEEWSARQAPSISER